MVKKLYFWQTIPKCMFENSNWGKVYTDISFSLMIIDKLLKLHIKNLLKNGRN